nr:immunoglobulin heavy chain junction region [Mus musculus]
CARSGSGYDVFDYW